MRCKLCSAEKTIVKDTRDDLHEGARRQILPKLKQLELTKEKINWRYRSRHCLQCNHRFHTIEIDISELIRIAHGNKNEKSEK